MERIQNNLLNDTYNLVQLARETARLRGSEKQAEKLTPVVGQLKTIVNQQREAAASQPSGILVQDDFRRLMEVQKSASSIPHSDSNERNKVITAMATGGMQDVDIARQMGMSRDEIRMVLNMANSNSRRLG